MKGQKLLFFMLAVTSWHFGQAQVQVHLGATTGYNATFVLDKGLSKDPRYNSTVTYNWSPIGFNAGVDFTRSFGLSLEAIQSLQGQVYEIIDVSQTVVGERRIDLTYINLPLLIRFMSRGNGVVRSNFNIGPQLSLLQDGSEVMEYAAHTQTFPSDATIPEGSKDIVQNPDGTVTATIPALSPSEILSKKANDFKTTEFQLAAAFGLDIDLSRHLYLSIQLRGNYSLTDMRNGDVIDQIKNGDRDEIFGQRANLLVGIQMGVHYMFGSTRSFKYKRGR